MDDDLIVENERKNRRCKMFCSQLVMLNNLKSGKLLTEHEYQNEREKLERRYRELLFYTP